MTGLASRVGQRAAIGIATERMATTRLKDGLFLRRVGQRVAIGIATERMATIRHVQNAPSAARIVKFTETDEI